MRDVAQQMMRLPLTVSLLGMQQLARWVSEAGKDPGAAGAVLGRAEAELGRWMREGFKAGDRLSEDIVDPLLGLLSREELASGQVLKPGFDMTRKIAEVFGPLVAGSELAWLEFGNKLQSFGTFRYVESVVGVTPKDEIPLADLVEKAGGLEPYVSVWATEGLGHYWAERAFRQQGLPEGLLLEAQTGALPSGCLVALHAGMGLSLAKHALNGVSDKAAEVQAALRHFVDLCQANARPAYVGVAFEALGLVVQTYYPALRFAVDRQLLAVAPDGADYFWHGVGRGSYFMPRSTAAWRPSDLSRLHAPHASGRLNLLSGLAWPLVLVNIRHPKIVAHFVGQHGDALSQDDAFATGVGAAFMVWRQATGGDAHLDRFCAFDVHGANRALRRHWEHLVLAPARAALGRNLAQVQQSGQFEALFSYERLRALVAGPPA